ncbi:MAG: hypothetical protein B6D39_05580 [Anaerolineae bacterium UTCFX2]|jgi:SAM-dependent methyltransferase|nr:class I SAM-dependent methyltransferase [Anaerolineae bacterium]MCZ7552367.1 class I SAM-dependent methyltransferase [Anaerolineales bacterium]OQY91837.1 MAG: hypothetical protein B6D39_05580 [Anaerolineae bacterium UTCFX2]
MFPLLYHAHHRLSNEDLPFWLGLASRYPGSVLELGCGTGRLLIPLLQAGHAVVGLDHDRDMLAALQSSLPPETRPALQLIQADFSAFHLERKFSSILLPCNTYSALNLDQRSRLLENVHRHLLPGGIFAASLPNPLQLRSLPPHAEAEVEQIFEHPLDGEPVQVSSAWEKNARTLRVFWHYDHLLPEGRVERTSVTSTHFLISPQDHLSEIHSAEFTTVEMLGDFDGSPFSADSPQLILLVSI